MSTTNKRVEAARAAAKAAGKPVSEVIATLAPDWGVSPFEAARIVHLARTTPDPGDAQPHLNAIAQRSAAKLAAQQQLDANAKAVVAFRNYATLKQTNPIAAAALMNNDPNTINLGRKLAAEPEPPEPPQAA